MPSVLVREKLPLELPYFLFEDRGCCLVLVVGGFVVGEALLVKKGFGLLVCHVLIL